MKTLKIPDGDYTWLKESIAEMSAMYADQSRDDWWDADDIARDVAEYIGDLIDNQEG